LPGYDTGCDLAIDALNVSQADPIWLRPSVTASSIGFVQWHPGAIEPTTVSRPGTAGSGASDRRKNRSAIVQMSPPHPMNQKMACLRVPRRLARGGYFAGIATHQVRRLAGQTRPASATTYSCHVPVTPIVMTRCPTARLSVPLPSSSITPTDSIPDLGELRRETVSAADSVHIAGMDRYRCHPDPDLAGAGIGNRAGLQVQNLGWFAQHVGDDGPHCSHLLLTCVRRRQPPYVGLPLGTSA
jgi:hypothetical protein